MIFPVSHLYIVKDIKTKKLSQVSRQKTLFPALLDRKVRKKEGIFWLLIQNKKTQRWNGDDFRDDLKLYLCIIWNRNSWEGARKNYLMRATGPTAIYQKCLAGLWISQERKQFCWKPYFTVIFKNRQLIELLKMVVKRVTDHSTRSGETE